MKFDHFVSAFEGQFIWLRNKIRKGEDFDSFIERIEGGKRFKQRVGQYKHWLTDEEWEHSPYLAMIIFVGLAYEAGFPHLAVTKELQIDDEEWEQLYESYRVYLKNMKADLKRGVRPHSRSAQGKFALKLSLVRNYLKVNFGREI